MAATATVMVRPMRSQEIEAVSGLVERSFRQAVAPQYSPEGVGTFLDFASPERIRQRINPDHHFWVAEVEGSLAGVAELRNPAHLTMLFVDPDFQHRGIGRCLFEACLAQVHMAFPDAKTLTVHASPNAVEAYQRLGFYPTDVPQERDGIKFLPMQVDL